MMIVAIAHTTSRHTTSTTGTTTAVLIVAPAVMVDMVTIVEGVIVLIVMVGVVIGCTVPVSVPSVVIVMVVSVISCTVVISVVVTMVTGGVLSRGALVVTVCAGLKSFKEHFLVFPLHFSVGRVQ